jgi:hypothetical protein
MDPAFIDQATWQAIVALIVASLWFTILAIGAALLLLVAHAVLPSLIATAQLPIQANWLRPVLSLLALGVAGFGILNLVSAVGLAVAVVRDLYPRFLI